MKRFIYILLLILPIITFGQQLPAPIIQNVSVIENTGQVQIEWQISDSVHIHIIRDTIEDVSGVPYYYFKEIDSVENIHLNTYIDYFADADSRSVSYRLRSYLRSRPDADYTLSNTFNTTFLEIEVDTCASKIDLYWTRENRKVVSDDQTIKEYQIYRNINNTGYNLIHTTTNTSFSDYDIQESSAHSYYVFAVTEEFPTFKSKSNTVSQFIDIPKTPKFIYSPVISGQNDILLVQFKIDPNSELEEYKLVRSDNPGGSFDTIYTFNTTDKTVQTNDMDLDATSESKFYHLVAINSCGNTLKHSDTVNNVYISAEQAGKIVTLKWNQFKPGKSNINYEIYRTDGVYAPVMVSVLEDQYEFTENLNDVPNNETINQFCYYVRAQNAASDTCCIAQSNTVCVYNNPVIYMPDGFTPNDDGKNDEFAPKMTFVPDSYSFMIYNKWGNLIFSTTDYSRPWDGRDKSGKNVPSGVYLYYLTVKSPNKQKVKKSGNVTVVYP